VFSLPTTDFRTEHSVDFPELGTPTISKNFCCEASWVR
jgi:hypothetical protein